MICFVLAASGQSKINKVKDLLKGIDKTWKLEIETPVKGQKKYRTVSGRLIGFLNFKKGKQEVTYCIF